MTNFTIDKKSYSLQEDESLLAAMKRHGLQPNFSCQKGTCRSCVVKITQGEIPQRAQEYLPAPAQERGYALACLCYPETDIELEFKPKPARSAEASN
jgi:ferredoxin